MLLPFLSLIGLPWYEFSGLGPAVFFALTVIVVLESGFSLQCDLVSEAGGKQKLKTRERENSRPHALPGLSECERRNPKA